MEAFDDPDYIYELKMDGFRCLAYIQDGIVDLRNKRNMRMLGKFLELKNIYQNVRGTCILDGEVVVLVNGVPFFFRLQKRTLLTDPFKMDLEMSRYPASFVAFDCLYLDGQELIWNPLMDRKEKLQRILRNVPESQFQDLSRHREKHCIGQRTRRNWKGLLRRKRTVSI